MTLASPRIVEPIEMPSTQPPRLAGFAELYAQHYDVVFRAALRVTGRLADAEDVLQTVFLRLLSQSDRDRGRERGGGGAEAWPTAYFKRAAVNAAVDLLRRRAVHGETVYDDLAPHAAVEPALLLKEQLRRAIATLENEDATLFLLRYVEGLSNEELASLFQLEKNNVAVRLHRIRMRLQKELDR